MIPKFLLTLVALILCTSVLKCDDALEKVDEIIGTINNGLIMNSVDFRGIMGIFTSQITDMRMEDLGNLIGATTSGILGKKVHKARFSKK